MAATQPWMKARQARVEPVALTTAGERSVLEVVLHLTDIREGQPVAIPLPVALVAEAGAGQTLAALRVYHSQWPLLGAHRVRPPLLPGRHLDVPDVVGRYQAALAAGDLEAILACFEPDGQAREPSGGPYLFRGPERLREFFGGALAQGGIVLEHCTLTDDGTRCAIEFNAVRWGQTELPRQAGVAVYEPGRSRLLAAARIYDDVTPPGQS
jgi:hypothetical protein